jgi:hypothetical protein
MWHAQVTSLTVRRYGSGSYAERTAYDAVVQVEFLGEGVAFIHAAHGVIGLTQWKNLARLLRDEYGVTEIQSERRGKSKTIDVLRES